jgi:hypothetical protein
MASPAKPLVFSYGIPNKRRDFVFFWLLALAIAGALFYTCLYSRVFPEASLELPLKRQEIAKRGRDMAQRFGFDVSQSIASTVSKPQPQPGKPPASVRTQPLGILTAPVDKSLIQSLTFTTFDEAKTFLEYELGLAKALALMRDKIPVWAWSVRLCREFTIEQCVLWLSPSGKLIAFEHNLEEEKKLPSLNHVAALKVALAFMQQEGQVEVDGLKIVRDETNAKINRVDHSFVLENQQDDFKGARLRYFIQVSGDRVTAYNNYLFVPDTWTRKYNHMRSYNELLQRIAGIFYSTLQLISVLVVPWALSRKEMRWRFALFGGMVMALTGLCDSLNEYSTVVAEYDTTSSFRDYLLQCYGSQGASAIGQFFFGTLLFGGADVLYRRFYPHRVALENFLRPSGFMTGEGLKAIWVGYLVFLVHLGWIIVYYLLGERLNFWCPLGIDNVGVLSATLPFYSAISLGLHASAQEETIARVVALTLGWRITRNFWVANLMQAMIWAFMHSSYAQQPAYARGVELTIVGLFYGYIMRRYGLLPCFIGHYLLDAFLEVKPLLSVGQGELWLYLSAFIPLVPFALVGVISWFIKSLIAAKPGGNELLQEREVSLTNDAIKPPPQAPVEHKRIGENYIYEPFSQKFRTIALVSSLIVIAITFFIKLDSCGDTARCKINRFTAIARAQKVLENAGVNPASYVVVPTLISDVAMEEMQYLYENVKRKRTLQLCEQTQPGFIWQVRFFRFLDPTEYRVRLRGDGSEYSLDISQDNETPGATIDDAKAKSLALDYIKRTHPDYKDFRISRLAREDKKNRRDYNIDFVVPALKVGDAEYKFYLQILGDKPCNFSQAWQVPDAWKYERAKVTESAAILNNVRYYTKVACVCFLIYWVITLLRAGVMQWRLPLVVAIVLALICIGEQLNHLPSVMFNYQTEISKNTYIFNCFIDYVRSAADIFWRLFLASALALGAFRLLVPGISFATILSVAFRPTTTTNRFYQKQMWIDGITAALACEALSQLKETACYFLSYYLSPEIRSAQIEILHSLNDYFSAVLSDLLDLPQSFVVSVTGFLVAAALYRRFCRNFWGYMALIFVYELIVQSDERHMQDYLIGVLSGTLNSLIIWIFVARLAKFNPVAYLIKIVLDDCLPFIYAIYAYGLPAMAPDMVSFFLYLLSPLAVLLYLKLRGAQAGKSNGVGASDNGEVVSTSSTADADQPPQESAVGPATSLESSVQTESPESSEQKD